MGHGGVGWVMEGMVHVGVRWVMQGWVGSWWGELGHVGWGGS